MGLKRRFLASAFLFLGLAIGSIFPAGATEGRWLRDRISGVQVWDEDPGDDTVISWAGGDLDGKASGAGVLVVFEGGELTTRYLGTMQLGLPEGPAEVHWIEAGERFSFIGSFFDGKPHGTGTITYADGSTLKSQFVNGEIGDYGAYRGANGERYDGDLKNGLPDGQGLFISEIGEVYEGEFHDGKRSGEGSLLLPDGTAMAGEFKDDEPNGFGRVTLPDGGVYEGHLADGTATGDGVYTSPEGSVYKGEFSNNEPNGSFEVTNPDGEQSTEVWKMGEKTIW